MSYKSRLRQSLTKLGVSMLNYLKRLDGVRPGRTPLRASDQPSGEEAQSDGEPQQSYKLDMNEKKISVDTNTGVALVLLRKKSFFDGLFGYTYILEQRLEKDGGDFPGAYTLYGGKIEYDASRDLLSRYEMARETAARELREETGVDITPNSLQRVISAVLHREGSSRIGVDVFINNDTSEDMINFKAIERYQQGKHQEAQELRDDIARMRAESDDQTNEAIDDKQAELDALREFTNSGPPIKIRRMWGKWFMFGKFLNKPKWHMMSPLTSYSLLADPSYEASARR
ncbi:MAG: NUDIX domain-containing protein [Pseudomonadota bacterium]